MTINPLLQKLGFSNNDRVVIFHTDDIGMCQASLTAYQDLIEYGLISAAATMVPCPWFPATAVYCRNNQAEHPHIDMGVHLTLTSEWDGFRWGPLSTTDPQSGLLDKEGYFYRQSAPVQAAAAPGAVEKEIEAQIQRALDAGIDVTHLDSHMGSLFHPKFLPAYLKMAHQFKLPALMIRADRIHENWVGANLSPETINSLYELEESGFPLLDQVEGMSLDQPENRIKEATEKLENLPVGISYFITHPSCDTPELRAIAPDYRCRVADYELFRSDAWRQVVEKSGVKVIGYRAVRDLMRQ